MKIEIKLTVRPPELSLGQLSLFYHKLKNFGDARAPELWPRTSSVLLQWAGRDTPHGPHLCKGFVYVFCWHFLSLTAGWRWKVSPASSLLTLTYPYFTDSLCKGHSLAHQSLYAASVLRIHSFNSQKSP